MGRKISRYGWIPDLPEDQRDFLYAAPSAVAGALPVSVDLRSQYPPVLSQLKGCFAVYESFESARTAKTGHASLPQPGESAIGGHAVIGDFTLPYPYLISANLASDFWTIRVVQ